MIEVTIGGKVYKATTMKLSRLRRAAPHLDKIDNAAEDTTTLDGMMSVFSEIVAVFAIAFEIEHPGITAEQIEDEVSFEEFGALRPQFRELLSASGLVPKGEASAPDPRPDAQATTETGASSE